MSKHLETIIISLSFLDNLFKDQILLSGLNAIEITKKVDEVFKNQIQGETKMSERKKLKLFYDYKRPHGSQQFLPTYSYDFQYQQESDENRRTSVEVL